MRLFFISFLVFMMCVLPQAARAQTDFDCLALKPFETRINITYETVDPVYDLSLGIDEMDNEHADERQDRWLRKNGLETLWTADDLVTQGLASGAWGMFMDFKLRSRNVDRLGAYHCAFFQEINLAVFYRTIIFIAKEFPQESCKFSVIHKHELDHHTTNQDVVGSYVIKLEEDVRKMIPYMEQRPAGSHRIEERFEDMKQGLSDAVRVYLKEAMTKEIEERNAIIDSPENYDEVDRLMHLCDVRDEYYRKKALIDAHKEKQRQEQRGVNE